jgi:hypothetical protein
VASVRQQEAQAEERHFKDRPRLIGEIREGRQGHAAGERHPNQRLDRREPLARERVQGQELRHQPQAFRVSTATKSSARLHAELVWDPPTSAAWDEATHNTRGLRERADLLFTAVTTARIDPNLWRDQRSLGQATHNLLDLANALGAYRDRVGGMPPGDGSAALALLDKA